MPGSPPLPERKMFFSPREFATLAGFHIQTVYRWCRDGTLPCERLPTGALRISRATVIRFMGGSPDAPEAWRFPPNVDMILAIEAKTATTSRSA